ncbi:MAG: ABC transporter permease [Ardenticatenales bacterium]|nr:ABC transporter permease [Ardenticatenales bacterium]
MLNYVVRRLLWFPFLLLLITLITFALGYYGPGDPVQQRLGLRSNPETVARLRAEMGLDRPFIIQYFDYVGRAARGDFGESFPLFLNKPVSELIRDRMWVSIQLNFASLFVATLVGIPLGILAALFRNTLLDYFLMAGTVAGVSFPTFVVGPILMWVFIEQLGVLTVGWDGLFSSKAILPVFILSLGPIAVLARQTRANLSEVLDAEYVRTARAKGLPEHMVILSHAMRNAMIPLITIFGLMLGGLVGGAFVTETLFGIPGIGRLGLDAFFARDYPIIMALTLIIAVAYAFTNLLVDILYALIDPRIHYR